MTEQSRTIRIGTRGSALALWQANHIADLLRKHHPNLNVEIEVLSTRGDRVLETPLPLIGGKGLFTAELEEALRLGVIDCAVHSLKDLPTDTSPGLPIVAIPQRGPVGDCLVTSAGSSLYSLPHGATVGTSSRRRAAQIRVLRNDLQILDIRGNVETRLRKALDAAGPYTATLLAEAGLERLGIQRSEIYHVPLEELLPAPGQGALAVQSRDEETLDSLFAPLRDLETTVAVQAERSFLAYLEGGCSTPVAALGRVRNGRLSLRGRVSAPDGSRQIDVDGVDDFVNATALGERLAIQALSSGADELLSP